MQHEDARKKLLGLTAANLQCEENRGHLYLSIVASIFEYSFYVEMAFDWLMFRI